MGRLELRQRPGLPLQQSLLGLLGRLGRRALPPLPALAALQLEFRCKAEACLGPLGALRLGGLRELRVASKLGGPWLAVGACGRCWLLPPWRLCVSSSNLSRMPLVSLCVLYRYPYPPVLSPVP